MSHSELCFLTASQLSRLYACRETSPTEVTRAVLERIQDLQPRVNAYITVLAEEALREAARAEGEILRGEQRGPLHGVPVSLKDLFYTRGVRTTGGSRVLADFVPAEDATVVARLRSAGVVLLGKTNMHEFAYGTTTRNIHYGPTRNPWDLERVPGGSSGGSGAAVAAGLGALSMGSDTGGSIRIPASVCGTVGLKPTYGRVSRHGVLPLSWSLDHVGPLTRSVEDAALALAATAGPDPLDPTASRVPLDDYVGALGGSIAGLRIGVPRGYFAEMVDPEIEQAFQACLTELVAQGARVQECAFDSARYAQYIGPCISQCEAASYHEPWLKSRAADYDPDVRDRLELGLTTLAAHYLRAQRSRTALQAELSQMLEQVDVLATPTTPIPAHPIDQKPVEPGAKPTQTRASLARFTSPFNLTGAPAVTVPCGFTAAGLPIGLQLVGRSFDEATILSIAHAYEQSTDWHKRRPPL